MFDPAFEKRFRAKKKAWADFEARPAWYRQAAIRWVMTAKKRETRERRLTTLIDDSSAGRTIAPLTRLPREISPWSPS